MSYQQINDFVIHFLTHNVGQEAVAKWLENDTQESFVNVSNSKSTKLTRGSTKKHKNNTDIPKRAKSPYIFFSCENRALIKEQNPEMDNRQIISELGRLWRDLDKNSAEAQRYYQMATEDKERFLKEKSETNEKPKKKQSGYSIYCKEKRASLKQDEKMTEADIRTEISTCWKNMTEEEKQEFKDRVA